MLAVSCVTQLNQTHSFSFTAFTHRLKWSCLFATVTGSPPAQWFKYTNRNKKNKACLTLNETVWALERSTAITAAAQTHLTMSASTGHTENCAWKYDMSFSIRPCAAEYMKVAISKYYKTIISWVLSIIFKWIY